MDEYWAAWAAQQSNSASPPPLIVVPVPDAAPSTPSAGPFQPKSPSSTDNITETLTNAFVNDEEDDLEVIAFDAMTPEIGEAMKKYEPLEWIVEDLLPKGCLIILAGLPKQSRKTLLAMYLALVISSADKDFLGKPTKHGSVVFANLEDGEPRCVRRLHDMGVPAGGLTKERPHPFRLLTNAEQFSRLGTYLRKKKPKPTLVVIDPVIEVELLSGIDNENDAGAMARMFKGWRTLAQETGVTLLFIHHFRKGGDTVRGSTAIHGSCDGWWELIPVKGKKDIRRLQFALRDGPEREAEISMTYKEGKFGVKLHSEGFVEIDSAEQSGKTAKRHRDVDPDDGPKGNKGKPEETDNEATIYQRVKRALEKAGVPMTKKDLREDARCRSVTLTRVLDAMIDDGEVVRGSGGKKYRLRGVECVEDLAENEDVEVSSTK